MGNGAHGTRQRGGPGQEGRADLLALFLRDALQYTRSASGNTCLNTSCTEVVLNSIDLPQLTSHVSPQDSSLKRQVAHWTVYRRLGISSDVLLRVTRRAVR